MLDEEANSERSSEDETDTVLSTSQIDILEDYALRKHRNETEGERGDGSERKDIKRGAPLGPKLPKHHRLKPRTVRGPPTLLYCGSGSGP